MASVFGLWPVCSDAVQLHLYEYHAYKTHQRAEYEIFVYQLFWIYITSNLWIGIN